MKFKAKDSEIVEDPICLGKISKDLSESNMKKKGLYGSVYYFSIDRNAVTVDKILDIHDYLYKKYDVQYKCLGLLKKTFISAMAFFSFNVFNVNSLECVSMNNQECKIRPEIINLNTNDPVCYPYSIKINKCKGAV